MRAGMDQMLPDDIHLLASNRLHISITRIWGHANISVNKFSSKDELMDALQASSFIPYMCGMSPPRFQGSLVADGFYTDNLPVFDSCTISISPFAGDTTICPKDDRLLSFLKIRLPHGRLSQSILTNMFQALET